MILPLINLLNDAAMIYIVSNLCMELETRMNLLSNFKPISNIYLIALQRSESKSTVLSGRIVTKVLHAGVDAKPWKAPKININWRYFAASCKRHQPPRTETKSDRCQKFFVLLSQRASPRRMYARVLSSISIKPTRYNKSRRCRVCIRIVAEQRGCQWKTACGQLHASYIWCTKCFGVNTKRCK